MLAVKLHLERADFVYYVRNTLRRFPMKILCAVLPLALMVSACSSKDEPEKGTEVNIDATGDDGSKVTITADSDTGKVGFKVPGFDANIQLPKALLNDTNFDIDGVKLYPGSTVASVNIKADDNAAQGKKSNVQIGFNAPDTPAKVSDWFKDQFAKKSVAVTGDASRLIGKTKDGDAFTIDFSAAEGGKTTGKVLITE
jgi:hypothetical protein